MSQGTLNRAPRPSSLADVLDLILDKGLVIDAYVRVSVVGIEILTIDARIVIASVDTYLHFAEAVNRLDLKQSGPKGLTEMLGKGSDDEDDSEADEQGHDSDGQQATNGSSRRELHQSKQASTEGDGGGKGQATTFARRLADRGKWEGSG
ncbi:MAG: gas vesicle protein [Actinomycetota bacterium]|nr:gas vesicle protein [Actinomycetota bacterium]